MLQGLWCVVGSKHPAGLRLMAYGIWALYEHDLRTACEAVLLRFSTV
jgi:hypothetical protein